MQHILPLNQKSGTATFNQLYYKYALLFSITPVFPPNSSHQLHVFWKYCDTLGVYGTQVCVFHQTNKIGLSGLMEGQDGTSLDSIPHGLTLKHFSDNP